MFVGFELKVFLLGCPHGCRLYVRDFCFLLDALRRKRMAFLVVAMRDTHELDHN